MHNAISIKSYSLYTRSEYITDLFFLKQDAITITPLLPGLAEYTYVSAEFLNASALNQPKHAISKRKY
jgi:hypothetical protein